MENKKMIVRSLSIVSVLVLVIGFSYALYSFSKTSNNSNLVVGNIYMHYNENQEGINLSGMTPSKTYNENAYFEFTIDGENTYQDKDINYEIVLNYGDNHATRKTRIKDGLLNFRLVQLDYNNVTKTYENEQVLFDNRSYESISNKRIWEDVITKSDGYIKRMYRLYMWYAYYTNIGNTSDADYDLDTWNNDVYASVKVNVSGDFVNKSIETTSNCFTITSTDTSNKITAYDATCGTDLIIPSEINGINVTEIGASAFKGKSLTSVFIPDTVTTIGNNAFQNNSIKTLKLSNNIQKISNYAFDNNKLTSIDIPSSVTSIGNYAFRNNLVTSLVIPNTVTTLGTYAFQNNKINSLTLPNSITTIPNYCFSNNLLESISIPDTVTSLSGFDNNKLTSITISSSVKTIGDSAFKNNSITSLVIPDTVTTLGTSAFQNNKINSLTLPNNITKIPNYCFANNLLESISIPETVTSLSGFDNNKLTSVNIPNSVTSLSGFSNNQLTSVTIPSLVNVINNSTFANNQLTSIEIPNSVVQIGLEAFKNNNLKTVVVGTGALYIGVSTFEKSNTSNPNLESIKVMKSCSKILEIRSSRINGAPVVYPWLASTSPYTASGVTIYDLNNKVCDSY